MPARSNVIRLPEDRPKSPPRARKIGVGHHDPSGWSEKDAAQLGQLAPPDNSPILGPSLVDLNSRTSTPFSTNDDGVRQIELADGAVVIEFPSDDFDVDVEDGPAREATFGDNLAEDMEEGELSALAAQLLEEIDQDDQSRKDVLDTRAKGIKLLGLKIEDFHSDAGASSAPLEGMSTVRHPLLLEACTTFQAGARAELLPSEGPVKVRSDAPIGAPSAFPGQPPMGQGQEPLDELAEALQTDMNHFLTVTATEYVPQHDRMLFGVGFSGDGFVKCYHHPLKMRPCAEIVDPEDLIVSNTATDLESCGRVTHRIRMRKSVLRRMQIVGAYRDVQITQQAVAPTPDAVKQEIADVSGARPEPVRPQDVDHTIYECYTELDLDRFAPKQFKGKALPLPYKVTIEKDSRQILEIRRNWKEDDALCQARQVFVQYPFILGLGFYSLGFLHLLGNLTLALTAAVREMLDAGMLANFPGFIYDKRAGRQLTNQFRCPPGGGVPLDVPPGSKVSDIASPLPYKEVGPAFPAFIQHVEQGARQVAMVANAPVAEGKQDAPVGTTLALIEQSTKVLGSAFKRLHIAQSKEFAILVDLFREDPEAMWRHNKKPARQWTKTQFLAALDRYELVPVADPNNPTSLHRMAKAAMLKTLQAANPQIYDPIAVDRRVMTLAGIDPEGVFATQHPQGPDPMQVVLQMRMQLEQTKLAIKDKELQIKATIAAMQQQGSAADRASKERIEGLKAQIAQMQVQEQAIVERLKMTNDMIQHVHGLMQESNRPAMEEQQHQQQMRHQDQQHQQKMQHQTLEQQQEQQNQRQMQAMKMQHAQDQHQAAMQAMENGYGASPPQQGG